MSTFGAPIVVGPTTPGKPFEGMIWVDTSTDGTPVVKVCTDDDDTVTWATLTQAS
jgi:hypothetical protein